MRKTDYYNMGGSGGVGGGGDTPLLSFLKRHHSDDVSVHLLCVLQNEIVLI